MQKKNIQAEVKYKKIRISCQQKKCYVSKSRKRYIAKQGVVIKRGVEIQSSYDKVILM